MFLQHIRFKRRKKKIPVNRILHCVIDFITKLTFFSFWNFSHDVCSLHTIYKIQLKSLTTKFRLYQTKYQAVVETHYHSRSLVM